MGLNPLGGTIPNLKFQGKKCLSPNFQWTLSADAWPVMLVLGLGLGLGFKDKETKHQ